MELVLFLLFEQVVRFLRTGGNSMTCSSTLSKTHMHCLIWISHFNTYSAVSTPLSIAHLVNDCRHLLETSQ